MSLVGQDLTKRSRLNIIWIKALWLLAQFCQTEQNIVVLIATGTLSCTILASNARSTPQQTVM